MKPANSLQRVLAVLDVFSEERLEWTPEALMKELGYSRPTLYRYLKILKDAGFLISTHSAGVTLGPRVVEMDYLMRKSDELVAAAAPLLRELTMLYPCTALLLRWYGNKILCIATEFSSRGPTTSYARGRPMALGRGSIARSIMAFLPRRRRQQVIEQNLADLRAVGLGATADEIQESLKKVRRTGYAVGYGEVTPGVIGVAAPILDARELPIASLCATIPGSLMSGSQIDAIGEHVRRMAASISARPAKVPQRT
jgi:DNA-binding IclR family transcriptional regulator